LGKTLTEILGVAEIVAGTLLQFTTGGQSIGLALIAAGLGTEAEAIFAKTPKPQSMESATKPTAAQTDGFDHLFMGSPTASVMAGLGRRGRDDLLEIDRHGQTYL